MSIVNSRIVTCDRCKMEITTWHEGWAHGVLDVPRSQPEQLFDFCPECWAYMMCQANVGCHSANRTASGKMA